MNRIGWILLLLFAASASCSAQDAYAPLTLYNGGWKVQKSGATAPDHLMNHCARLGTYYSCEQEVNGKESALIVFVPGDAPGKYHTQAILPSGFATGRGDLEINGDHWIYIGKDVENTKTTWYRTTNEFKGKDHIHFEQAQSEDGSHWKVTGSGDEERVVVKQ